MDGATMQALGRTLEWLLAGLPVETAAAALPDDLRAAVVQGLSSA